MAVIVGANTPTTPNMLTGTDDADSITAGTRADTINGLGGADTIAGGSLVHGGADDDQIQAWGGAYFGDAGDDHLTENGGDSVYVFLDGGAGNDILGTPTAQSPTFHGISIAAYGDATGDVHVDLRLDSVPQDVGGGSGTDTLIAVSGVVGGPGNDTIIGTDPGNGLTGGNLLIGGDGNDSIDAGGGDDVVVDGPGNDTLDGGAGAHDLLTFGFQTASGIEAFHLNGPTSGVTVDLSNTGPQDIGGGMGVDVIRSFEQLSGSAFSDSLTGSAGADYISGGTGNGVDTINGGAGNDELHAGVGGGLILGGQGDDAIFGGGLSFNYLQGNQGNDYLLGSGGNDWVVGGQDQDTAVGGAGNDIVYGNLGNDEVHGGDGDDIVRGGQGNDLVDGGAGNDFVAGDRGDDTLTGGQGADRFYSFADAGIDRVTDFNRAEGDRVEIETGDSWTVAQVGADTVITVGGSGQSILAGVTMSSLTGDWIFSGTT